jgi:hypothetical protein
MNAKVKLETDLPDFELLLSAMKYIHCQDL